MVGWLDGSCGWKMNSCAKLLEMAIVRWLWSWLWCKQLTTVTHSHGSKFKPQISKAKLLSAWDAGCFKLHHKENINPDVAGHATVSTHFSHGWVQLSMLRKWTRAKQFWRLCPFASRGRASDSSASLHQNVGAEVLGSLWKILSLQILQSHWVALLRHWTWVPCETTFGKDFAVSPDSIHMYEDVYCQGHWTFFVHRIFACCYHLWGL